MDIVDRSMVTITKERYDFHVAEIERLKEICNNQAMILRRMAPDRFPDTYFIHSGDGHKDQNGMPERLLVCPAYGADFSYVYQRTGITTGPKW